MQSFCTVIAAAAFASLLVCSSAMAKPGDAPPTVDVNVVNDQLSPVPVVSTEPIFYRVNRTVFGDGGDRIDRIIVETPVILYDVYARTNSIRDLAGCAVDVFLEPESGPSVFLFATVHYEKDVHVSRDGQTTQQRLGRGVVVEAGMDIVIRESYVTDPDIPPFLPDAFCSANVQIFGEVVPQ